MRVMKTDNAVDVWPDAALKNFIFYIFSMYEFSHSLGQTRLSHLTPKSSNVRCCSNSVQNIASRRMTRRANSCGQPVPPEHPLGGFFRLTRTMPQGRHNARGATPSVTPQSLALCQIGR